MSDLEVLTRDGMRKSYGEFYSRFSGAWNLELESVPPDLRVIVHYAEFWGVSDDGDRENQVLAAPIHVRQNLKAVIHQFDDALNDWLAGAEADLRRPSDSYIAFSAMRMAADFI